VAKVPSSAFSSNAPPSARAARRCWRACCPKKKPTTIAGKRATIAFFFSSFCSFLLFFCPKIQPRFLSFGGLRCGASIDQQVARASREGVPRVSIPSGGCSARRVFWGETARVGRRIVLKKPAEDQVPVARENAKFVSERFATEHGIFGKFLAPAVAPTNQVGLMEVFRSPSGLAPGWLQPAAQYLLRFLSRLGTPSCWRARAGLCLPLFGRGRRPPGTKARRRGPAVWGRK